MSSLDDAGSQGGHGRNWAPAKTIDGYLRNCREGIEEWSDRRAAKLLGRSRTWLFRCRLLAELPAPLFESLLVAGVRTRGLATIALALRRGCQTPEIERCRNCGAAVRICGISLQHLSIVNDWIAASGGER